MKCLQLGYGFKCEFCKCINITLISLFLSQIIGLNHATKLANETKKLTSVSNNTNQQHQVKISDKSNNQLNSSNTNHGKAFRYEQINILQNSTSDIRRNSSNGIKQHPLNRQFEKHFYNITIPIPADSTQTKPPNKNHTLDELYVSDSQNVARISRSDEEPEEEEQQHHHHQHNKHYQPQLLDEDDSVDKASSNLNEQKVVRELTKILSEGMSGATDQVKLDTLEQWKRRRRERKVVKDSRAKLFEDLLTAAINTHPEKVKKSKKRTKQPEKDENKSNLYSPSLLSTYPSLDSELSSDAETVIQHLQGLASVIDGSTPAFSPGAKLESGDLSSASDDPPSDSYSSADNYTNDNDSLSEGAEKGTKTKVASSSHDRPIVKQFKQIKNKISQRRKQLDQIKKIFNVDLSLSKNGLLQGNSSSKKNKEAASSESNEVGDYSDDESSSSKVKKKSSSSSSSSSTKKEKDKMQDLMSYLKENPEILASVMDELTASSEYTTKSLGEGETLFQGPDDSQLNYPSLSRKLYLTSRQYDTDNNSLYNNKRLNRVSDWPNHDLSNSLRRQRVRNLVDNSHTSDDQLLNTQTNTSLVPLVPKHLSAEALLLESLRERQLMNLLRLEKVLAEKYQSSNRSQVYSSLNQTRQMSNFSPRTQLLPSSPITTDHRQDNIDHQQRFSSSVSRMSNDYQNGRQYNSNNTRQFNTNGQTDEEVLHHYMVMNSAAHQNSGVSDSLDDNIVQQNQLIGKPYNQRSQQQLQLSQQQLQPQQQYNQLNRFRDWRDVSHSEASPSQRSDKTNFPNNITRLPYDLTTGSSATPIDTHSPSSVHSSSNQLSSFLRQSSSNDAKIDTQSGAYNSARNYADSVITKPGPQTMSNSIQHNYQQSIKPTGSLFMTRSSTIRGEPKPQPTNIDLNGETDLDDGDNKSSQRGETTSPSNDEEFPIERARRTTNLNGPADYFSAYKRTGPLVATNYDKNNRQDTSTHTSNQKREKQQQQDSDNDAVESEDRDAGAMWAK